MYRKLKAVRDTYLHDRFIRQRRRERSNVGQAGTLDMFKLYGVNKSGSLDAIELSRALIKFDLDPLRALTGSGLDITHSSFKCHVNLKDVYGGQPTPSNFTLFVAPVSRSWDEGIGSDVVSYNDIDSSNFLTASYTAGASSLWFMSGANKGGLLGSADIDIILSGNLSDGQGVSSLTSSQVFAAGTEDMLVDVTRVVSATLKGLIPDEGFRVSFTAAEETDTATRFVKRFASRHVSDPELQPRLVVKYNDSVRDDQANSFFDLSNTVFLYNYDRDGLANLTSGSAQTPITGTNSLVMKLITDSPAVGPSGGLFNLVVTASQHSVGSTFLTGVYSASFTLLSTHNELSPRLVLSESIEFTQIWGSIDGTVGFKTGSKYRIYKQDRRFASRTHRNYAINATNMRHSYRSDERVRVRIFAQSLDDFSTVATKLPVKSTSTIFTSAYYSIRDAYANDVAVPFETTYSATKLSTDGDGMYFDLFMSDLNPGKVYEIDMLVRDGGMDDVYRNVGLRFRVIEV